MEHYKLSFLRKVKHGANLETVYIQVNNGKPEIMFHNYADNRPLNSKVEAITEEEFKKVQNRSRIDFGH